MPPGRLGGNPLRRRSAARRRGSDGKCPTRGAVPQGRWSGLRWGRRAGGTTGGNNRAQARPGRRAEGEEGRAGGFPSRRPFGRTARRGGARSSRSRRERGGEDRIIVPGGQGAGAAEGPANSPVRGAGPPSGRRSGAASRPPREGKRRGGKRRREASGGEGPPRRPGPAAGARPSPRAARLRRRRGALRKRRPPRRAGVS